MLVGRNASERRIGQYVMSVPERRECVRSVRRYPLEREVNRGKNHLWTYRRQKRRVRTAKDTDLGPPT